MISGLQVDVFVLRTITQHHASKLSMRAILMYCSVLEIKVKGQFRKHPHSMCDCSRAYVLRLTSLTDRKVFVFGWQVKRFRMLNIWARVLNSVYPVSGACVQYK